MLAAAPCCRILSDSDFSPPAAEEAARAQGSKSESAEGSKEQNFGCTTRSVYLRPANQPTHKASYCHALIVKSPGSLFPDMEPDQISDQLIQQRKGHGSQFA